MKVSRTLAAAATAVALSLASAGAALARPSVTVRVEGVHKTLLPARTVTAPASGSITKGHTPAGACRAQSAAGALDVATHHNWGGSYSHGLGIEVSTILGTTYSYTKGAYWGFYVDNHYASTGVCDAALHPGEQLLFAAVPAKGKVPLPIVLRAPRKASAGRAFTVKALYYPGKGNATKPLAGVKLAGANATTNAKGVATVTARRAGRLALVGSHSGYIRSAAVTVSVG